MIPFLLVVLGTQAQIHPTWDLLSDPKVRTEIHLAPQTSAEVVQAMRDAKARYEQESRGRIVTEAITPEGKIHQLAIPALTKIGAKLSAEQRKRLIQLTVQQYRSGRFNLPGVQETLGVDGTTLERINRDRTAINARFERKADEYALKHHLRMIGMKGGGQYPEFTPEIQKIDSAREAALWQVVHKDLSPEQNDRLKALLGRPFKQ